MELVSIITPSYNCEKFIGKTILSVISQTYEKWEMIIVDDLSTDNTTSIVKEMIAKDSRIKLIIQKKNGGAAIARNVAIKNSTGRYIAFLDSDDLWFPDKLERQLEFMRLNNLALTYSSYKTIDENDNEIGQFITQPQISYKQILKSNIIGCLTAVYDTKITGKTYMPEIQKRQDYGLWLRLLKQDINAMGILEPLASYRIHANSLSKNKFSAAKYQWKIYRNIEKLNIFKSIYYFIHYVFRGVFKYK